ADVLVLGDREFAPGSEDVIPVREDVAGQGQRIADTPAVPGQQLDRLGKGGRCFRASGGQGQLEWLTVPPGQIQELEELDVLAPGIRLPFPAEVLAGLLPAGDRGERGGSAARFLTPLPVPPVEYDWLPGRLVVEAGYRNTAVHRPQVFPVGEMVRVGI